MKHATWILAALGGCLWFNAAQAVEPKPPTLTVRMKSVEGMISDLKTLAKLVDQGDQAEQIEKMLPSWIGPKGFAGSGLDTKRPMGMYGVVTPAGIDSFAALMLPVADETAASDMIGSLLKNYGGSLKKGEDGITCVTVPNSPVDAYFTFANRYLYITAKDKTAIEADKRITPESLFKPNDPALLGITVRIDQVDENLKQIALGQLEVQMSEAKDRKEPNETELQKKFRVQMIDYVANQIKSFFVHGQSLEAQLIMDQGKEDLGLLVSLKGKPGSPLAQDIQSLAKRPGIDLGTLGSTMKMGLNLAMPEALQPAALAMIEEGFRKSLEKEKDAEKRELATKIFKVILPTLQNGRMDMAMSMNGPDAQGHFSISSVMKAKETKQLENLVKSVIRDSKDPNIQRFVKLDAQGIAGTSIHQIEMKVGLDADAKRMFGNDAKILLAFPEDRIVVTLGANTEEAMKTALAGMAPAKSAKVVNMVGSLSRLMALDKNRGSDARSAAEKIFGPNPQGTDTIRISLEGGEALELKAFMKLKVLSLATKLQ